MYRQFGPFKLFDFSNPHVSALESSLESLFSNCDKSKAKGWKFVSQITNNLEQVARWTFNYRNEIAREFPHTKDGHIWKNRNMLIKQYGYNVKSSGQSMGSRGFEGTNYRLIVASDSNRTLLCRYGEYLNLSGTLLFFRDNFPEIEICEICQNDDSKGLCTLCGRWYCQQCSHTCEACNQTICKSCATKNGPTMSAHMWYFHRNNN